MGLVRWHCDQTLNPNIVQQAARLRFVLDTICGGVWYAYLDRPAYKNLTHEQAQRAVDLCREIAEGRVDLQQLNNQSLIWRGKSRVRT